MLTKPRPRFWRPSWSVSAMVVGAFAVVDAAAGAGTSAVEGGSTPAVAATAPLTARPAGWGMHGMAVFGGREGLYASHLPMFHPPHDAQVVLRFHLQDAGNDAALRSALALQPALWTLEPEKFDLHRLAPGHAAPLRAFGARLVQGHFERGGTTRYAGQLVVVDEVLVFRRLNAEKRERSAGRYRVVGTGQERFLIKEIDRRPDFDLILALTPLASASLRLPGIILLPTDSLGAPALADWKVALQHQAGPGVTAAAMLYFETEDLK